LTLDPHIGIIYGDGLSADEIKECIKTLVLAQWSAETCVYGMGGGLLQKHNRDTQKSAFKCSAQKRDGQWIDICKTPLDVTKISKKGRLKLVWQDGSHGKTLITVPENDTREDVLQTVFENGDIVKDWTWEEVKSNSQIKLLEEIY
jgi:nicotinamide phosphoribosyltransferase